MRQRGGSVSMSGLSPPASSTGAFPTRLAPTSASRSRPATDRASTPEPDSPPRRWDPRAPWSQGFRAAHPTVPRLQGARTPFATLGDNRNRLVWSGIAAVGRPAEPPVATTASVTGSSDRLGCGGRGRFCSGGSFLAVPRFPSSTTTDGPRARLALCFRFAAPIPAGLPPDPALLDPSFALRASRTVWCPGLRPSRRDVHRTRCRGPRTNEVWGRGAVRPEGLERCDWIGRCRHASGGSPWGCRGVT